MAPETGHVMPCMPLLAYVFPEYFRLYLVLKSTKKKNNKKMVGIQMAEIHTNTLNKLITGGLRFYCQETGLSSMSRSLTLQNCGTLASTHFWNCFRLLNGTIQAPSQNSFKISKCHPGVLVGGQLSSMLKEGVISC